jgi:hypothetical protein
VTFPAMHAASVPGSLLPLGFYGFGMSLATPDIAESQLLTESELPGCPFFAPDALTDALAEAP